MNTTSLIITLIKTVVFVGGIITAAAYFVLLERWIAAWVQQRLGPNRVGLPLSVFNKRWSDLRLFGLGQPAADGLKIILKEDYNPAQVDLRLFILAPLVILSAAVAVFAVVPFGGSLPAIPAWGVDQPIPLIGAPGIDVALIYVFALTSLAVYGVILGGWASNSKYSFLGALRSSAQMISYELPLGLGILGVVIAVGSLRLDRIIDAQADSGFWFAFTQPLGFVVFLVAAFAESARLPFDLPECEQELIGGYHTEYSGIKLLLFLTGEFIHMVLASFLIAILFLGGWHFWGLTGDSQSPLTWGVAIVRVIVLLAKVLGCILFFMLVRWTWPRFRFDQLMTLAWKVMLPLGVVNLIAVIVLNELRMMGWLRDVPASYALTTVSVIDWVVALAAWALVAWFSPLITDNRPQSVMRQFGVDSPANYN